VAVSVAVCVELTAAIVAVKPALAELAGTLTEVGSVTEASLLKRFTVSPPVGATALALTVQASVPAPVMDALVHVMPLSTATGLSCTANVSDALPALAVNVAVCAVETAVAVAVNVALAEFAGTVTEAGTVIDISPLLSSTLKPPLAAGAFNTTMHASVAAPVTAPFAQ
jgi:hypothetical protein